MDRVFGFLLVLLTASTLSAQTPPRADGRQALEKPGLALVKPQKWSKPNEAVVVRFTAATNRGGYFVLRLPSGQERQVWVEQMVGGAPIFEPAIPDEILNPSHLKELQGQLLSYKRHVASVPSAARDIAQLTQPISEAIRQFEKGDVRVKSVWISASSYKSEEFANAETKLRQSFSEESEKSKFELTENSLFKQLVELSKDIPRLQARVEAVRADFQKQVQAEQQDAIIARLSDPNTSNSDALEALVQLRAIPSPNEQVGRILGQAEMASLIEKEIEKFQGAMEEHFATPGVGEEPPRLPANLAFQNQLLAEQIAKFRASSPPPAIRIPEETARAMAEVCEGFPKILPLLEQRNYVEAATLTNRLAAQATKFSPSTQAILLTLKTAATQKVDLFAKLRSEGEAEETAGNKPAAIAKYSAALEISPDAELASKIEQLQNPAQ
jgi:hypothetical protein